MPTDQPAAPAPVFDVARLKPAYWRLTGPSTLYCGGPIGRTRFDMAATELSPRHEASAVHGARAFVFNPQLPMILLSRPHKEDELRFPETGLVRRSMDQYLADATG